MMKFKSCHHPSSQINYNLFYNDGGFGYTLLVTIKKERTYDEILSLTVLKKSTLNFYLYLLESTNMLKSNIIIYEQNQKIVGSKNYLITKWGEKELEKLRKLH